MTVPYGAKCCAQIPIPGTNSKAERPPAWNCSRRATRRYDGRYYCTQHDPVGKKARARQRAKEKQHAVAMGTWSYKRERLALTAYRILMQDSYTALSLDTTRSDIRAHERNRPKE